MVDEPAKDGADEWSEKGVGLVLAGAVAQGAFGAGAVSSLAKKNPRILRVAGTSSGALNAVLVAAGVATGDLQRAMPILTNLWLNHGSWTDIVHFKAADLVHLRGLLDTKRLAKIVYDGLKQIFDASSGQARTPVHLTLVTTNLDGLPSKSSPVPLPTYEKPMVFTEANFNDKDQWPEIANAAVASATFPILFSPTKTTAAGGAPCVDGGAVNNAPISYVLWDRTTGINTGVGKVVVVTSESSQVKAKPDFGGLDLASRVAEVVINERVARDLVAAHKANKRYDAIYAALSGKVPDDTRDQVLRALQYRHVDLYLVRPDPPLAGDSFSGFFCRADRRSYIRAGETARMIPIV